MNFDDTVAFHGHACPGLAIGYRVACKALQEFGLRARDEELVAIVENNSCAVDAIQLICGCTFGKGNLHFYDYGKQVYTFIKRPAGEAVRIALKWEAPPEDAETASLWKRFRDGDRCMEVMEAVQQSKKQKMEKILSAADLDLFEIKRVGVKLPQPAQIYQSVSCSVCGEKVMEPRTRTIGDKLVCLPCAEKEMK